jgi:hypothetical protein
MVGDAGGEIVLVFNALQAFGGQALVLALERLKIAPQRYGRASSVEAECGLHGLSFVAGFEGGIGYGVFRVGSFGGGGKSVGGRGSAEAVALACRLGQIRRSCVELCGARWRGTGVDWAGCVRIGRIGGRSGGAGGNRWGDC